MSPDRGRPDGIGRSTFTALLRRSPVSTVQRRAARETRRIEASDRPRLHGEIVLCPAVGHFVGPLAEKISRSADRICLRVDARARQSASTRRGSCRSSFPITPTGTSYCETIVDTSCAEVWVTQKPRMRSCTGARHAGCRRDRFICSASAKKTRPKSERMNRVALLLDRLSFEPSRNGKLRLMTDTSAIRRSGAGLGARGADRSLTFHTYQASGRPSLLAERMDPVLFEMSHDFVSDLFRRRSRCSGAAGVVQRQFVEPSAAAAVRKSSIRSHGAPESRFAARDLARCAGQRRAEWAPLKLITRALRRRFGASRQDRGRGTRRRGARRDQVVWHGQSAPISSCFRWLAGKGKSRHPSIPRRSRPARMAQPLDEKRHWTGMDRGRREWKWDGIRLQVSSGLGADGERVLRL